MIEVKRWRAQFDKVAAMAHEKRGEKRCILISRYEVHTWKKKNRGRKLAKKRAENLKDIRQTTCTDGNTVIREA
jgi:hypothetical protein